MHDPHQETIHTDYTDRGRLLIGLGLLLLLAGVALAVLAPAEIYTFYLFSVGGRFYYDGFGFGSFMFGNIAAQIIGYYLVAVLLIPLGLGHISLRPWARTFSLVLLYAWLVVGVPMTILFFLVLFASKDLPAVASWTALLLIPLFYPVVPFLLLRFYQSRDVKATFHRRQTGEDWLEGRPLPVLVLAFLLGLIAIVLHIPFFFRGLFPLFGTYLVDLEGILALALSILCLVFLVWGVLRQKAWAWWGSVLVVSLLAFSSVLTLARTSFAQLLALLRFPPREMEFLDGLPLRGWHLAAFLGLPLLLTLGILLLSKRHFGQQRPSLI
jgi:MFS family permease